MVSSKRKRDSIEAFLVRGEELKKLRESGSDSTKKSTQPVQATTFSTSKKRNGNNASSTSSSSGKKGPMDHFLRGSMKTTTNKPRLNVGADSNSDPRKRRLQATAKITSKTSDDKHSSNVKPSASSSTGNSVPHSFFGFPRRTAVTSKNPSGSLAGGQNPKVDSPPATETASEASNKQSASNTSIVSSSVHSGQGKPTFFSAKPKHELHGIGAQRNSPQARHKQVSKPTFGSSSNIGLSSKNNVLTDLTNTNDSNSKPVASFPTALVKNASQSNAATKYSNSAFTTLKQPPALMPARGLQPTGVVGHGLDVVVGNRDSASISTEVRSLVSHSRPSRTGGSNVSYEFPPHFPQHVQVLLHDAIPKYPKYGSLPLSFIEKCLPRYKEFGEQLVKQGFALNKDSSLLKDVKLVGKDSHFTIENTYPHCYLAKFENHKDKVGSTCHGLNRYEDYLNDDEKPLDKMFSVIDFNKHYGAQDEQLRSLWKTTIVDPFSEDMPKHTINEQLQQYKETGITPLVRRLCVGITNNIDESHEFGGAAEIQGVQILLINRMCESALQAHFASTIDESKCVHELHRLDVDAFRKSQEIARIGVDGLFEAIDKHYKHILTPKRLKDMLKLPRTLTSSCEPGGINKELAFTPMATKHMFGNGDELDFMDAFENPTPDDKDRYNADSYSVDDREKARGRISSRIDRARTQGGYHYVDRNKDAYQKSKTDLETTLKEKGFHEMYKFLGAKYFLCHDEETDTVSMIFVTGPLSFMCHNDPKFEIKHWLRPMVVRAIEAELNRLFFIKVEHGDAGVDAAQNEPDQNFLYAFANFVQIRVGCKMASYTAGLTAFKQLLVGSDKNLFDKKFHRLSKKDYSQALSIAARTSDKRVADGVEVSRVADHFAARRFLTMVCSGDDDSETAIVKKIEQALDLLRENVTAGTFQKRVKSLIDGGHVKDRLKTLIIRTKEARQANGGNRINHTPHNQAMMKTINQHLRKIKSRVDEKGECFSWVNGCKVGSYKEVDTPEPGDALYFFGKNKKPISIRRNTGEWHHNLKFLEEIDEGIEAFPATFQFSSLYNRIVPREKLKKGDPNCFKLDSNVYGMESAHCRKGPFGQNEERTKGRVLMRFFRYDHPRNETKRSRSKPQASRNTKKRSTTTKA